MEVNMTRLQKYLQKKETGKKLQKTMIGYKVSFSEIQKLSEYIKSWLDRYNIPYKQNQDVHVTVAQIPGKYSKDKIIRTMQGLPSNITLSPKKLKLLYGQNVKKWFITIEYKKHDKYLKAHEDIKKSLPEVMSFPGGMKPHISLFTLNTNEVDPYLWNEITQRNLKLPKIKVKDIQLYNSNFAQEFILKK
jgi:hypothetical protein